MSSEGCDVGRCAECGAPIIITLMFHEAYDLSTLDRLGIEPGEVDCEAQMVDRGRQHLMVQIFCATDPAHEHGLSFDEDGLLDRVGDANADA